MSENGEIKVPSLGESISEASVGRWLKEPGQMVQKDELLVELETDKITLEITSPVQGVLTDITHPSGATVTVGQILGLVQAGKTGPESALPSDVLAPAATPSAPAPEVSPSSPLESTGLSPAVKKMVTEKNISPSEIQGTGKDGRITKGDVILHMEQPFGAPKNLSPISPSMPSPSRELQGEKEKRVRMTRLRQKIAQRLKEAQHTAAILTTFNEVDMSAIYGLRTTYKDSFEKKHGIKLGFMSFFVKAAIKALKEFPEINAEIEGDSVIYKDYYDIGVAVSAPQGLVVPVVRDADLLSFAEVEKTIAEMGLRAREGKLGIDEMMGGTFTISNGGIFGSLMSTPILNPPQTGILGMHKTMERPVAVNGKVEIRPMMYLALSYDHRLVDGREAVGFLVRIKETIENPERLLLDV